MKLSRGANLVPFPIIFTLFVSIINIFAVMPKKLIFLDKRDILPGHGINTFTLLTMIHLRNLILPIVPNDRI